MAKIKLSDFQNKIFQTDNLYIFLAQRKILLEEIINQKTKALELAPKGSIDVVTNSKRPKRIQYYYRETPNQKHGKYLKKGNELLIKNVIQSEYDRKILKKARTELLFIKKLLKQLQKSNLQNVYESMNRHKKKWVVPVIPETETFIRQWYEQNPVNNVRDADHTHQTDKNEWTRSKSEKFIANALNAAGVPYVYELPLREKNYPWACPDFKVLNVRTREEYLWEHLGLMDNTAYVERNLEKIEKYEAHGFIPCKNLLLTFETQNKPLRSDQIELIIQNFFL